MNDTQKELDRVWGISFHRYAEILAPSQGEHFVGDTFGGMRFGQALKLAADIADDVTNAYLSRDARFIQYPWEDWKYVLPRFLRR